jgi:hypothetical protein
MNNTMRTPRVTSTTTTPWRRALQAAKTTTSPMMGSAQTKQWNTMEKKNLEKTRTNCHNDNERKNTKK